MGRNTELNATSNDLIDAMELLKARKIAVQRQIETLQAKIDALKREEKLELKYGHDSRGRRIAEAVLVEGRTIKQAGFKEGIGPAAARALLHRYCAHKDSALYKSGFHRECYANGNESDCPPSLGYLREHFAQKI